MTTRTPHGPVDWDDVRRRVDAVGHALAGAAGMDDAERDRVLRERARRLAEPPTAAPAMREPADLLTFTLGGERYGVDARYVAEIRRPQSLTPLPGAEPPLVAVTAWRGDLLSVRDLRAALGLPSGGDLPPWMLVMGARKAAFAILADEPGQVERVDLAELGGGGGHPLVRGTTNDAVVVIDAVALLRTHR
jgi:purine-binding chemotaxis protein CheW